MLGFLESIIGGRVKRALAIVSITLGIGFAMAAALLATYFLTDAFAEEVSRLDSPDGHYQLIVYRRPRLYAMPGQGSDAPGYVVLIDNNGNVLQRREVEMVQLISKPRWTERRVRMKLLFDWPLPEPEDRNK